MRKQAVLFDLDGTLLDTLQDLHGSVCYMLNALGLPVITRAQTRQFVGNGIESLLRRALHTAAPQDFSESLLQKALALYLPHYGLHANDCTAAYDGILPLLRTLREKDIKTAVISNKNDAPVQALCAQYFPDLLDVAIGLQPQIPAKPAPDCANAALRWLQIPRENAIYVGDSEVDAETAQNAGLPFLGVTWGFRDAEILREAGAKILCSNAAELLKSLQAWQTA